MQMLMTCIVIFFFFAPIWPIIKDFWQRVFDGLCYLCRFRYRLARRWWRLHYRRTSASWPADPSRQVVARRVREALQNRNCLAPALPDDSQFLAASHAALGIVDRFGILPDKQKAESVGVLTFLLLDLLKDQVSASRDLPQTRNAD